MIDNYLQVEKFDDYMFLYFCCSVMKGAKKTGNKLNVLNVKGTLLKIKLECITYKII